MTKTPESDHAISFPDDQASWDPSPVFLRYALATLLIGCLSYLVVIRLLMPEQTSRYVGPALGAILAVWAWRFLLLGKLHQAIKLMAIGSWFLVTFVSVFQGGVLTPAAIAYPVIIVLIGWLFSARAAFVMAGVTATTIFGFVVGEANGWLVKPQPTPVIMYGVIQILLTVLAAFLVNFLIRSYKTRLQQVHEAGLELAKRTLQLETSQTNLAITIASTQMVLWEYDMVGDQLIYDESMLEWLGLVSVDAPHTLSQWLDLLHPDDQHQFMSSFTQSIQADSSDMNLDYRISAKCGDWIWLHTRGKVMQRSTSGKAIRLGGGSVNITERKLAEEQLKQSEALLRSMLESTDEGILMVAKDGRVLSLNKRFLELWRVPPELAGLSEGTALLTVARDQLADPDSFTNQIRRVYGGNEEARDTLNFKDGRVFASFSRALATGSAGGRIWCYRDITEQAKSSATLAESLNLLRSVIDTAPMRVFWKDQDLHYLGCNPAFAQDAGVNVPDDLIGKTDVELSWKDQAELYCADDRQVMNSGMPKLLYDEPQTTADGKTIWLRTSKVPLRNAQDEVVGVLGMYEDITQLKQTEQAMYQSEERFRSLTRLSSDWYWEQDSNFRFIRMDGDLQLMTGITANDHYGLTRWDMPALNLSETDWQAHKSLLQQHLPFHDFEMRRPNRAGREHWVSISGTPIFDNQGLFCGYQGVGKDITERKRAEVVIKDSAQLLRGAIDTVDEAFALFSPEDQLVFCNDKYRKIYANIAHLMEPGVTFESLVRAGAESGQYTDARGRVDEWVRDRMAVHLASNSTVIQKHENGRTLRIIERKMPDGHIVGFRMDITELVRATEDAQAANQAKSRFLATMSHEIRTPMNGILGMAQLLLMPDLMERERLDYARTILSCGQTLLTLLNDILDLSKIEAGKFQIDVIPFDPESIIHEVKNLFTAAAEAKNLQLDCQWQGATGQRYQADAHRLRQMISNLVGNAIKFTKTGKVRIECLEIDREDDSVMLEFAVIDTGIGIETDKLGLLFKPFSQTDNSTTRQFGGSGLGLSIVSSLAHAMGGSVGVASEPGKGSRFWFRIRADSMASDQESRQTERHPSHTDTAANPDAMQGHVLVVEDNQVNRMVICALLSQVGLTHAVAHDGQQAVDAILRGDRPDLILMDLHMPVLDGYSATEQIRQWEFEKKQPRLPIIALTADAFEEDHQHCLAVGMDDFLTKPISIHTLRQALAQWLPTLPTSALAVQGSATPVALLDFRQFTALVNELTPLLEHNKFQALNTIKKIQSLVAGTFIEAEINKISELLQTFRFHEALERLRSVAALQIH